MRLENEGLTQREGRGWKVTPIDLAEVRAVMEFREAVEVAAVRLAVERADDEDLAALRALSEAHRGCDDEETGLRDFSDFHLALARLSRNQFLADGMDGAPTRLSRMRWLGVRTPQSRSDARDEHLRIIAAIRARDTDAAVALTVAHNRDTGERLLGYLTEERRRLRGRGFSIIESAAARRRCGRSEFGNDHRGSARWAAAPVRLPSSRSTSDSISASDRLSSSRIHCANATPNTVAADWAARVAAAADAAPRNAVASAAARPASLCSSRSWRAGFWSITVCRRRE